MHKFLFILAGIIVLLILFMTLTHFKTIEEAYHGGGGGHHGGGGGHHVGGGGHHGGGGGHHGGGGGHHGGIVQHPEYYRGGGGGGYYSWGFFPVYAEYEYPVYYVNDQDDYIFDENGILYYIYNPHLLWRKLVGEPRF